MKIILKAYFPILLILKLLTAHSQNLSDDVISYKIKQRYMNLKKAGIDTILTYQAKSTFSSIKLIPNHANKEILDSIICQSENPTYILWASKGIIFIEKINSCFTFNPLRVNSDRMALLLKSNPGILKSSQIKPFQFKDKSGRILGMTVSHTMITKLTAILGNVKKEILIDNYNLTKSSDSNLNINYKVNQKNIQFKITEEIKHIISRLKFERQALL